MHSFNNIEGLLFDKDGTLIDFSATWLQPMKDVAELVATAAGRPDLGMQLLIEGGYIPESDSWAKDSFIAFETSEAILDRWAAMTSPALIKSLLPEIQSVIYACLRHAVPVVDDTIGLFAHLNTRYALGVASMDDEINVKQTLDGLGVHEQLRFYCGADSGFGHKPEPGMVHAFCEKVDLAPEQIAVIGDATHDLKMAGAAGALAIGVLSGASSEETLREHADILIRDIGELTEHLF